MGPLDRNNKNTLLEIWKKVRKDHLFPEIADPEFKEGDEAVGLDIKDKRIRISKEFVERMSERVPVESLFEGLLDHAVSHYLFCPWDLTNHIRLYREAKKILKSRDLAKRATDLFMDVVADTTCVSQKETPIPHIYRSADKNEVQSAIYALYQKIWEVDLGVQGHEEVSRKLSRLPYMDRSKWLESIKRFSRIIAPLLKKELNTQSMQNPGPMGSHSISSYSEEEIHKALREIASEVKGPSEFSDLVSDFEKDLKEGLGEKEASMGLGPGRSLDADILYYMKLAERYMLPVKKIPMKRSGSLYPHHHSPWEVGKPFQDIDPWTSFGKLMPGITQTWIRKEGEIFGNEERIPDCIIIIDSSGSMPDPKRHLSYAVLGAACACDAYLRSDAQVAVYNFSDAGAGGKRILPFSKKRKDIYRAICHYFGGGTRLMVEHIESLQNSQIPDIFLITDMQITNLETLIEYFNECKNRVTAVHIGKSRQVETFRQSLQIRKNISIFAVEKKEDIPKIVLGKVKEYIVHQ